MADDAERPARPDRPLPQSPERSRLLGRVRQTRTAPEEAVAKALRALGLAYRRNVRSLPGSPDFANATRRFAIFVNGCFWHAHTGCRRATTPKNNRAFWVAKFAANRARDAAAIRALRARGFRVMVIWECEAANAEARLARRLGSAAAGPLPRS
ncbi:MAG: very short patch repair endonuclease [Hyphomicrobiales bacterium]|nr:very short patch repair endonuclease [Hyphomicrobiales bacterium]